MSVNKFFAVLIFCVLCLVLGSSRLRAEETIPFTNPNFHPVPTAIIVDVPYTFMDSDIAVWDQYSSDLVVKNIDIWLFRDTGYGGVTLVVNKFMQSIYVAQKMGHTVLIEIVGPAYSGHAYIACAADKVIFDPGSSLMFHSAGREVEYLHGLITYVDSTVTPSSDILQNTMLEKCKQSGLLDDKDIQYIKKDGDVTVTMAAGKLFKIYTPDPDRSIKLLTDILGLLGIAGLALLFISLAKRV